MRKRVSLEMIVIAICFGGILVSGYSLLFSKKKSHDFEGENSVGLVRPVGRDIRVKGEVDSNWNQIARDASVFNNDRVYTGQHSQAKVTLKNEQKFTVEPNSLVVITDGNNKQTVEFTSGGLLANLKKGIKLFVKHQDQETEYTATQNTTIRLSSPKKGGNLKLVVLKGEAEVKRPESTKPERVSANSELAVSKRDSKPVTSSFQLFSPEAGEEKWSKNTTVPFRWEKTPSGGKAKIEVSTDPEFQTLVASGESTSNQMDLQLPARNIYFWRVVSDDATSVVSSFSLQALIPPQVSPSSEMDIETTTDGRNTNDTYFAWNDQLASDEYEIEISQNPEFSQLTESRRVLTTSATIPSLKVGTHYWRVRSKALNRESLVSNTGKLVLRKKEKPIPLPVAEAPAPAPPVAQPPLSESASLIAATPQIALPEKVVAEAVRTPAEAVSQATPQPELPVMEAKLEESKPKPRPQTPLKPQLQEKTIVKVTPPLEHKRLRKAPLIQPPQTNLEKPKLAKSRKPAAEDSKLVAQKELNSAQRPPRKIWLWAGAGSNYQYYQQTIPSVDGEAKFNNVQSPTMMMRGGFQGTTWGVDASYKDTPGTMESSSSVSVLNGTYNWRTLTLEGLYRIHSLWNLRFGVQHHAMPFIVLNASTSTIDITSNTLTLATIGFDRSFTLSRKWRGEWLMRYQQPLSSAGGNGTSFKIHPKFAFDGSLGGVYDLGNQFLLGAYWYGQWHEYKFDYGDNSSNSFSGSQTLFYSNIEMRLGFEF